MPYKYFEADRYFIACLQSMRIHFLTTILLLLCLHSFSQEREFIFSRLDESDGLSDKIVNCFLKDSRGILWIGTYNGLNRFDGSNFYVYKKNKRRNSIINEVVQSLCEDKQGNIWGGTDKGIFCYHPEEDKFYNFPAKSYEKSTWFFNILCDRNGDIWVTGTWSVLKFNKKKNQFDEVIRLTENRDSLDKFSIRKNGLQPDPTRNAFWFATSSGLYYYDIQKNRLSNYANQPGNPLFVRNYVSALSKSPSGNFWFANADTKELVLFNPSTRKIIRKINISGILPNANVTTLFENKNDLLWLSSFTYEIAVIDLTSGEVQQLKNKAGDSRSIPGNFFWSAFQDEDGTNWIGTSCGIARCNPEKSFYRSLHLAEKIPLLKETSIVLAEEDPYDTSIWLITRSDLLIHFLPWNGKSEIFDPKKAKPTSEGSKPGVANSIKFLKNKVVLTTYTGAWQIERGGHTLTPFSFLPAGYKNFKCSEMTIIEDSVIYFNDGQKLLYWNYVNGRTELINLIPAPKEARTKTILAGLTYHTGARPFVVIPENKIAYVDTRNKLVPITIIKDEKTETGTVKSIVTDAEGKVWIDNLGIGLYCFNPKTAEIKSWDESDGLASNRTRKIDIDNEGRIWCIFYNKISVFIPGSEKFFNLRIPYSENDLNYNNWISRGANGHILCAINNELFECFPERLGAKPNSGKPHISQVIVSKKEYAVCNMHSLTLPPEENTVRFLFGTYTDKEIFPYQLQYKLEGAEMNWTNAKGNNEALYNNLPPGDYTFKVKAKGINDAWETDESTFAITIQSPYYKTIWFRSLLILLVSTFLFAFYRYRLLQKEKLLMLENKAQLLEKDKVMVMYESLKQQLNPHFLFNSLTSLSGLIEIDQAMAVEFLEQMSGIYRYILKHGDRAIVMLKDEVEFVKLYVNLQQTRFKKGLIVDIQIPDAYLYAKIAPVALQNLIENAIKHNVIDESSPLKIEIYIEDDYIAVKNNLQKKSMVETSNKKGLEQFTTLYKYLSEKPVVIEETITHFSIKVPLI